MAIENQHATLGLENPWPSSPKHPPRFNVTISGSPHMPFLATGVRTMYAAKYLVSIIIDDREWRWKDEKTIVCDDGITIRSDHLEEIVEYKMTATERKWLPNSPTFEEWHSIASGKAPQERARKPKATTSDEPTPKKTKPVSTGPKPSKDGLITVGEIAQQLGLDPKQCRIALRKSKIEKPAAGWAWPPAEVDAVKATIKKHAK